MRIYAAGGGAGHGPTHLVDAGCLFHRSKWADQVMVSVEFEIHGRFDFKIRVTLHRRAEVLAKSDAVQLHAVADPAIRHLAQVELAHGRREALQALAIGGKVDWRADGRRRVGGERVDGSG